jgi:coatomer subunit beta'
MPLKLDAKKRLVTRSERVKCVDLHPTENWILVSLYDGKVHIWHYETQQLLKTFEVNSGPVRAAKFVPKKNWIVCGSDDFRITVYNYNTSERVKQFDAHDDYVRSIVLHPTQPYIISSGDDMTIKLWNWDKDFLNMQTFEGHAHYVMQVVINPKDSNTFASASLDRTIKVWQLGSSEPNFTLQGHERGVNCVDYYPGNDKPYLISGSDDKTVKIWDYQTKTCVQTLEGHFENISAVAYYPDLPIILTASEDSTVRVWNMNTYRLEQALNYGMGRVWTMACLKNSNNLALGYDNGSIVLKLGREEPSMSMDPTGKIVWAKHSELQQANIKTLGSREGIKDGVILPLQVKDIGPCEIYPQTISHNPNGRYLVVCGDGQYIIQTALTLRNKAFGNAQDFVWSSDPSLYAIRDGSVKIYNNASNEIKLHKQFKPDFGCDGIYGGFMLGVRNLAGLAFYDWTTLELIRRIEVVSKNVYWSESGEFLCITSKDQFYILKYNPDAVVKGREIGTDEYVTEDGYENAFDVVADVSENVKSGMWVRDCFVFTNSDDKLSYFVGGEIVTIALLERPMYILGYLQKENKVYLGDKEFNVVSYTLSLSVLKYQMAVMQGDFETADSILPDIPENQRTRVAYFLEKQNHKERALAITNDPGHKFDLAVSLKNLEVSYKLAEEEESDDKRKQVADLALAQSNFELAGQCMRKIKDAAGMLFLASATGDRKMFQDVAEMSKSKGLLNIALASNFVLGNKEQVLESITSTESCVPNAAMLARSWKDADLTSQMVSQWKDLLRPKNPATATKIPDPKVYPNLFPDLTRHQE